MKFSGHPMRCGGYLMKFGGHPMKLLVKHMILFIPDIRVDCRRNYQNNIDGFYTIFLTTRKTKRRQRQQSRNNKVFIKNILKTKSRQKFIINQMYVNEIIILNSRP